MVPYMHLVEIEIEKKRHPRMSPSKKRWSYSIEYHSL